MKNPIKKTLTFYAVWPLIWVFSHTPTRLLYLVSDGLYWVVFGVFKYRKKVVYTNLQNAFPEWTAQKVDETARKYYRFLCDFLVETAKYIAISKSEITKRVSVADLRFFDSYVANKQSVIFILGHYGNWEWAAPASTLQIPMQLYVVYKKLSNSYFDRLMIETRSKFGTKLMEMNDVARTMLKQRDELTANIFVGDQTPFPDQAFWTTFLNQDTPVFRGAEVLAKKFNYPVVYVSVQRPKRGYYVIHTELITNQPKDTPDGWICTQYCKLLERDIKKQPELWLWSHRRWKHKKPAGLKA